MNTDILISNLLNEPLIPAPSATLVIDQKVKEARTKGKVVHHFGFGGSPFPVPDSMTAALMAHAGERAYLPAVGLLELRVAIAGYLRDRFDIAADAQRIVVAPGSKMLLYLLMQVTKGPVLLPRPSWVSYAPQNVMTGHRTIWCDTHEADGHLITAEGLRRCLDGLKERPRFLLINYPNNPTGCTYSPVALKALAEAAREEGIVIISDEIYAELDHHGAHQSIATLYPEGTILTSGISKWCGAGGWRLGYMHLPAELDYVRDAVIASATETYSCAAAPVQYAAIEAFRDHHRHDEMLRKSRIILARIAEYFREKMVPLGAKITSPEGAFYLLMDLSAFAEVAKANGIEDDVAMCDHMFTEGTVAYLPGSAFGMPAEQFTMRVALTDFDGAALLQLDEQKLRTTPVQELAPMIHAGILHTAEVLSFTKTRTT